MAINSITPWGGLAWSPASVPNCSGAFVPFGGDGCCPSNPDQLRFAMMRQLQWMESMLERLAGMLGGAQQNQQPLPCFGAGVPACGPSPCAPAPCSGGPVFSAPPSAPAAGAPAPVPSAPQSGSSGMKSGAPPGYHTIKGAVPPGVTAKAQSLLNQPMGSEHSFEIDGKRYLARLEHHYHPPGYVGGPNGWHKGVSVYEAN
jgi:hypothetical protein